MLHNSDAPVKQRSPAFVLVHSPVVGPTTWLPVARELERRGRDAVVPSLLGVAEAPAPQWRHAPGAVRAATAGTDAPIVLVGHSGAGPLLPAIADVLPVEVVAFVFVDSFLPPARGSLPLAPPGLLEQMRALATDGVLPPWSSWFGEEGMRDLVPDEGLRVALERDMPRLPLAYFEEDVPVPEGWDAAPCAYLVLTAEPYGKAAADAQRRGWPMIEIPGARHLAIATHPAAVTDGLLDLERALI